MGKSQKMRDVRGHVAKTSAGVSLRKRVSHTKLIGDVREREAKHQVKAAKSGWINDND